MPRYGGVRVQSDQLVKEEDGERRISLSCVCAPSLPRSSDNCKGEGGYDQVHWLLIV